jgi:hypothetical protein
VVNAADSPNITSSGGWDAFVLRFSVLPQLLRMGGGAASVAANPSAVYLNGEAAMAALADDNKWQLHPDAHSALAAFAC